MSVGCVVMADIEILEWLWTTRWKAQNKLVETDKIPKKGQLPSRAGMTREAWNAIRESVNNEFWDNEGLYKNVTRAKFAELRQVLPEHIGEIDRILGLYDGVYTREDRITYCDALQEFRRKIRGRK